MLLWMTFTFFWTSKYKGGRYMPTSKIYGLKTNLNPIKKELSAVINSCVSNALNFPKEKRLQRFFPMETEDFYHGEGRSDKYTIIEIALFEGRSKETIRELITSLYSEIEKHFGISKVDVDILIIELPKQNWGLQGALGDEQNLGYKVEI